MFLPLGDTPNPRGVPIVNYLLIAANLVVFALVTLPLSHARPDLNDPLLLEYLRALGARGALPVDLVLERVRAYDLVVFQYGFRPAAPSLPSLFTAMFLHAGWLHLLGNMLFLWIFGDNLEHRLGRFGYLGLYLGTGVAATLFFALFVPGSQVPMIGASGAISGVLGGYYIWFPRNRVKTFIFLFPFIMDTFYIPARLVLGFYLVVDNLIPFLLVGSSGSGVAHGAHIGGFLAGLALAFGLDRLPAARLRQRLKRSVVEEGDAAGKGRLRDPDEVARQLQLGNPRWAAGLYFALDSRQQRGQVPSAVVLELGEYLLQQRDFDQAQALFRRFLAERPADPEIARAYLGAGKAIIHKPRSITSAYQYFLAALDTARTAAVEQEARLHLRAIERLGEPD